MCLGLCGYPWNGCREIGRLGERVDGILDLSLCVMVSDIWYVCILSTYAQCHFRH